MIKLNEEQIKIMVDALKTYADKAFWGKFDCDRGSWCWTVHSDAHPNKTAKNALDKIETQLLDTENQVVGTKFVVKLEQDFIFCSDMNDPKSPKIIKIQGKKIKRLTLSNTENRNWKYKIPKGTCKMTAIKNPFGYDGSFFVLDELPKKFMIGCSLGYLVQNGAIIRKVKEDSK